MVDENSYIKLSRKIINWPWFKDPKVLQMFLYLLLIANFAESEENGFKIHRGQIYKSISLIADKMDITRRQAEYAIKKLVSTGEIKYQPMGQRSLITIVKYDRYQSFGNKTIVKKPPTKKKEENSEEAFVRHPPPEGFDSWEEYRVWLVENT